MKRKIALTSILFTTILFALAATGYAVPTAGELVKVTRNGIDSGDTFMNGGVFKAEDPNSNWTSYDIFCLERNEYISLGGVYRVDTISDGAVNGGVGSPSPGFDPIIAQTAFLYTKWLEGERTFGGSTDFTGAHFQEAIWDFEDEYTAATAEALALIGIADTAVSTGAWIGLGNVRVMNLVAQNDSSDHKQSMLTTVPEPATLLLMGVGLIGIAGYGRRKINS